jgi:hypothetical protein
LSRIDWQCLAAAAVPTKIEKMMRHKIQAINIGTTTTMYARQHRTCTLHPLEWDAW